MSKKQGIGALKKKVPEFQDWLVYCGAKILEPTNPWEVVRFRALGKVQIIYKNAKNEWNFTACDMEPVNAFLAGRSWSAVKISPRKQRKPQEVLILLKRDGDNCFLCGFPMGDDVTVEHLLPISIGGPNHMGNYALTHSRCNELLGNKSLMEKIKLREHHQNWTGVSQ